MHYCHLTQNSDKLEPFDSIKFIHQSAENLPKCATLIHLLKTRRNLGLSQLSQRILGPLMFLKAGFHQRWSQSRSCNQKRRAYDLVKTAFRFHLRLRCLRSAYDLVKTRLSESEAEAEEPNQLQSVGTCIVIGLPFCFCFQLRQSGFHQIICGTKATESSVESEENGNVLILLTPIPSRL